MWTKLFSWSSSRSFCSPLSGSTAPTVWSSGLKCLRSSGCLTYRGTLSNSQLWNLCLALQRRPWNVLFSSRPFNPPPWRVFFLCSFVACLLRDWSRLWLMHTRQNLMRLPETLWFPGEFPPPLQPCVWSSGARAVWGGGRWHRDGGGRDRRGSSYHETFSLNLTYAYAQRTLQTRLVRFHL